jgi:polygalacturonase
LLISGVTIENAGHEHLVPERDTNVTISGISINDHNSIINSLNTTHTYLQNTDGIDYSGSNFLIQNCTIAAGDDDIVAKPGGSVDPTSSCNNIVINNCNIYSGHGISIGGGTVNGVSNMIVANCTFNPALGSDPTKNSVTYGLRMKAEDGADTTIAPMDKESGDFGGGIAQPLKNVKFINISMTGVQHSIAIESFYNGGDTFASSGTDSTKYTYGSNPNGTPPTALSSSTPLWQNIAFENVTATSTSSNPSKINGLNISTDLVNIPYANALDGLSFSNVKLTGSGQFQLYYGANIDLSGLTLTGMTQSLFGLTNVTAGGVPLYPGDFNRDGHVTGADLGAMLMAFKDLPTYESSNGLSDAQMEVIFDLNNDFQINNADMQTFLTLLSTGLGSASSVPEPATLVLLGAGGLMLMFCYRRRAFVRKSMVASMMVD